MDGWYTFIFSRTGDFSSKFDVRRPLGRFSSNKLCQAIKRFAISVPLVSNPCPNNNTMFKRSQKNTCQTHK